MASLGRTDPGWSSIGDLELAAGSASGDASGDASNATVADGAPEVVNITFAWGLEA